MLTDHLKGSAGQEARWSDTAARPSRTFRDPSGYVELHKDAVYRFLQPAAQAELLTFLNTPLAERLVHEGKLVASAVLSREEATAALEEEVPAGTQVLRHPLIPFVSYPWEWCPAQWLAAAELTLNLNRELIAEGWILKDATPLNILFQGSRPVLVDVASVARIDYTKPIWFAYSQFVRTFLLPMLAHKSLGWPLRASLLRRDGLEPEEIFAALPVAHRIQQPALSSVTLPSVLGKARSRQAVTAAEQSAKERAPDPELVQHILLRTSRTLLKQMQRAVPRATASKWTAYSGTATHYSEADHEAKRTFVARVLRAERPKCVLDIGANAGVYSGLAAEAGARVVAVDTDLQTLDRLFLKLQQPENATKEILPLVVDLANPSPGLGWRNREFTSFLHRAVGHFDGLIMLAVIHHLLLHDHIPLADVAELASRLTTRTLVIEWVPSTDPMFRELVRGREAIFSGLTEAAFREHFSAYFETIEELVLGNGRTLFHLQRHSPR